MQFVERQRRPVAARYLTGVPVSALGHVPKVVTAAERCPLDSLLRGAAGRLRAQSFRRAQSFSSFLQVWLKPRAVAPALGSEDGDTERDRTSSVSVQEGKECSDLGEGDE
ncbi:hypothetical protein NDU88_009479 [Pleurodeles waltl]|uniref:Uncharacterized protein n=1 Tax=Pleurodeles waltl TaxID=8319 RepID=A0AAV7P2C0_PLEWA|nr:hypothetical protein NDU88_009479 [Pleurodeles waltl]